MSEIIISTLIALFIAHLFRRDRIVTFIFFYCRKKNFSGFRNGLDTFDTNKRMKDIVQIGKNLPLILKILVWIYK